MVLGATDLKAEGFVHLALHRPTAALFGDRIILRDEATGRVVAGGRVIDPFPPARRVPREQRAASLTAMAEPEAPTALAGLLRAEGWVDLARFGSARNLDSLNGLDGGIRIGRLAHPILVSNETNESLGQALLRLNEEDPSLTMIQNPRTHDIVLWGQGEMHLRVALERLSDPRTVLLVNTQSGRAAVQLPARSLMTDDGEVESRVRLLRPMEHPTLPVAAMAQTCWKETDRTSFANAWLAEVAEVPEFTESDIHIVTGLLLPIWKRLPQDSTRIFRLQTDAGERIIGRKVSPQWVSDVFTGEVVTLSPDQALASLLSCNVVLDLAERLQLRRTRIMNTPRIELTGFTDVMRDRLTAFGLFHEIIAWKLRMFVPTDAAGEAVLGRLFERYPLLRVAERAGA